MPELFPVRQDTWEVSLEIYNNVGKLEPWEVWDKKTGGEVDSEDVKYYPGGMADPLSLGGRVTIGNITLQRIYRKGRDHDKVANLMSYVGKNRCVVHQRPLNKNTKDGFTTDGFRDTAITYTGVIKRVLVPEVDSEASGASLLEVEIAPDGSVAVS